MSTESMNGSETRRYGSDVMVDLLRKLEIPYASLNPGATFRGLHDSLVNWESGGPPIITCPHEKVAVGVAHGYAKVTGKPMAVVLHDLVGLLQSSMGLYYAFHDRVPILALGGSGPADTTRRRPAIDWYHSANVQGNAVRDFVKWDDEPRSVQAAGESILRAWRTSLSGPPGPVYVALDADLQEQEVPADLTAPDPEDYPLPSAPAAHPLAIDSLARRLINANFPVVVAGFAGRDPRAFTLLPELAQTVGCAVIDSGARLSMPSPHPLNLTGSNVLREADEVLLLDCKDAEPLIAKTDPATRIATSLLPEGAGVTSLGFGDLGMRSWAQDQGRLLPLRQEIVADTTIALEQLLARCRALVAAEDPVASGRRRTRCRRLADMSNATRNEAFAEANTLADLHPVSTARLALEVREAIVGHDWVLTAGTSRGWARRLWNFDTPYRHPGDSLGTATQIGISLGVALAHRGSGRLVVDLQPDGDLMFDLGSLWVASYYRIPLLCVMVNNRAYYNDWHHQEIVARWRGRPVENAHVGMEIARPAPDFSRIARAQGWWAEGPIDSPGKVRDAVRRAADVVANTGQPALVDVVTQLS
jgi:benzoylformate decarboxylase/acetolactate synthase-1/2/3 large subunit